MSLFVSIQVYVKYSCMSKKKILKNWFNTSSISFVTLLDSDRVVTALRMGGIFRFFQNIFVYLIPQKMYNP
jgi:hypothetical protein